MKKNIKRKVTTKKRTKLTPLPLLKKKVWQAFSQFIRLRDANNKGWCKCCTCGKPVFWTGTSGANAGHFITRRGNSMLLLEETDVHSQHRICNKLQRNGISWDYTEFMINKYGLEHIRKLASMRGKPFKFTRDFLEDKLKYYTEKVEQLRKEKNL